jgi:hypothetical protein
MFPQNRAEQPIGRERSIRSIRNTMTVMRANLAHPAPLVFYCRGLCITGIVAISAMDRFCECHVSKLRIAQT